MPGTYDGQPGAITFDSSQNVSGASNTNPITITVSGALPANFFTAGYGGSPAAPLVDITGVEGNTAANGQWVATPTGASTFTIPTAGNGAYTTGGKVQPLYLKSEYTLPVDGDSDNSASIATWGQATGDRTQWLASRTGFLKHAGMVVLQNAFGPARGALAIITSALTSGTWNQFICQNALTVLGAEQGMLDPGQIGVGGQPAVYSASNYHSLDIAIVELDCEVSTNADGYFGLFSAATVPGAAAPSWPADFTLIPGTARQILSAALLDYHGKGYLPHMVNGQLWITPAFYASTSTTYTVAAQDSLQLEFHAYRITNMPQ